MNTTPHPHVQLSAFLDGALAPADREAVESHLAGCAECRTHLAELRATASLLASLPELAPSRRLTPRFSAVPAWLAPLRTLATLASGLSVFLFVASALLGNIATLSSGAATTALNAPAAAPAAGRAEVSGPQSPGLGAGTPAPQDRNATSDAAQKFATSASPTAGAVAAAPAPGATAHAESATESVRPAATRTLGPSPWLWLVLAVVMGAIAIALQRRLRSTS